MARDIVDRSAPTDISRRAAVMMLATGVAGCSGLSQTTTSTNIQLTVSPESSLLEEPLSIRLIDLSPSEKVTIWTSFTDAEGVEWRSYAYFEADETGEITPADQSVLEGTYEGQDPLGLLWSRRPVDPEPAIIRPVFDNQFELQVVVTQNDDRVTETTVTRRIADPDLHRIEPEHNPGVLFEPAGEGPHPGILLFHGSNGEPMIELAKLFASHGYAAFALQYFGPPREVPDRLQQVPLSLVEESAAWLRNQSRVSNSEIGLIGWSRGSEIALLAGSILDEIGVVIGVSPSGLVFDGYLIESEPVHAWAYEDEEFSHIPIDSSTRYFIDAASAAPRGAPIGSTPLFEAALREADEQQIEAATIPVEEIDAPLFLFSGTDDATWPAVQLATYAEQRRNEHNLPVDHHIYEGAGHLIGSSPATVPTTQTTTGSHFFVQGLTEDYGGTPEANAAANADAWSRILRAFEEGLR